MRSLLRLSVFLLLVPASLSADRLSTKYRSWTNRRKPIEEKFEAVAKASITRETPGR